MLLHFPLRNEKGDFAGRLLLWSRTCQRRGESLRVASLNVIMEVERPAALCVLCGSQINQSLY